MRSSDKEPHGHWPIGSIPGHVTLFFLLNQLRLAANVKWYPKYLQMVSKVFAKVEQCLLLWLSCTCDRIRKENVKACRVTLNLNSLSKFKSFRTKTITVCGLQSKCKETFTNHGGRVAMLLQKMGNVDLPLLYGRASRGQSPRLIGFFKLSSIGCSPHSHSALLRHQLLSPNLLFSNNSNHCLLHHCK